jgi:phage protein D
VRLALRGSIDSAERARGSDEWQKSTSALPHRPERTLVPKGRCGRLARNNERSGAVKVRTSAARLVLKQAFAAEENAEAEVRRQSRAEVAGNGP